MKTILAISSSPSKKFNSDTMLDAFIEGAKAIPDITVEKIYLSDFSIAYYDFNRRAPLPEEKDLLTITEKIKNAQGLVIATPTWNFSVPAQLKNLVDRMGFMALDYKHLNSMKQPTGQLGYLKTFFLISAGSPSWVVRLGFFLFPSLWLKTVFAYFGAHNTGSIYGTNLSGTSTAQSNPALLKQCTEAGSRFAKNL